MTWNCPVSHPYYNSTSDLCQNLCANYYYENTTINSCSLCYYACIDCTSGSSTKCTACEPSTNRVLINTTNSTQCQCSSGYFDDGYSSACRSCSTVIVNCSTCTYTLNSSLGTTYYSTVFNSTTWQTDILPNFTCTLCNSPLFYNSTAKTCTSCTLNYCLTCSSLTECTSCNSTAGSIKNTTNNLCYLCTLSQCTMCSADNVCSTCASPYKLTSSNNCLLCNQTCDCNDGWVLPFVNGACSTVCGDNIKLGTE